MNCELCNSEPRVSKRLCGTCLETIGRLAYFPKHVYKARPYFDAREAASPVRKPASNSKKPVMPTVNRGRDRKRQGVLLKNVEQLFKLGE